MVRGGHSPSVAAPCRRQPPTAPRLSWVRSGDRYADLKGEPDSGQSANDNVALDQAALRAPQAVVQQVLPISVRCPGAAGCIWISRPRTSRSTLERVS